MKYQVALSAPYPNVENVRKNPMDAKKLMNSSYGGRNSETGAILTYAYQSYVVKKENPELASMLEQVAVVEMKHHELLGTAIYSLGGLPVVAGRNAYFSAAGLDYSVRAEEFLVRNVREEEAAIREYEALEKTLATPEIRELVKRIVDDETLHVKLFSETLAKMH